VQKWLLLLDGHERTSGDTCTGTTNFRLGL
jgi:hypothetical protein